MPKTHTETAADVLPTLRVQTVLYENSPVALERSFEALVASLRLSSSELGGWVVVFGDSSSARVVNRAWVEERQRQATAAGGEFEYVFFRQNLGHGGGHNRLFAGSKETLLLIVNPDGIIEPETIPRLLAGLTPATGVLDARQLPMEHPKEYDPATGEASWSSLACALTPARVFREVGGIDHETFFMYCDDVDYSWRVRLAGYSARYCPEARMFHDKRLDAKGLLMAGAAEQYYSAEAALLLAYKYSRNDIVQSLEKMMTASTDGNLQRAVAEFRERRSTGRLPHQIDQLHSVAEFTGGTYGGHRF